MCPVIIEVLRQLGVFDDAAVKELAEHARPQLYNQRNIRIGEIVLAFRLKRD
jgi:hypothetical protein